MQYLQVLQLRDLQVQVQVGLGRRHEYDWRDTTDKLLDHISLTVKKDTKTNAFSCFVCLELTFSMFLHHLDHCGFYHWTRIVLLYSPCHPWGHVRSKKPSDREHFGGVAREFNSKMD